ILGACVTLAAATALLSPAATTAQQVKDQTESSPRRDVPVRVENHNWLDMHVYALRAGAPARTLGWVTAHSSKVFNLPASVTEAGTDLRVLADPIGSRDLYVSDPVLADPESEIVVTLENELDISNTRVVPHRAG
ncbi:MAG: hypothetical protein PVF90_10865, partial [Gemmatimonadota bacterium]